MPSFRDRRRTPTGDSSQRMRRPRSTFVTCQVDGEMVIRWYRGTSSIAVNKWHVAYATRLSDRIANTDLGFYRDSSMTSRLDTDYCDDAGAFHCASLCRATDRGCSRPSRYFSLPVITPATFAFDCCASFRPPLFNPYHSAAYQHPSRVPQLWSPPSPNG